MFFILSKLLLLAFSPGLWLLALLVAAMVARPAGRWRGRWLGAALLLLLLGGNNALVNSATLVWELPPVPLAAVAPADAAVLLTGITAEGKSPHDRVYLNSGADRLTNALWLYRAGRVRRIIISGGSNALHPVPGRTSEARQLSTLLRLAGVPPSAILLEERSRNTRENALYTKQLLASHPAIKSLVLVTSAFHERRALGCFAKVGLHPVPFPAGYRSTDPSQGLSYWLLPSLDALSRWGRLLHELVGYAAYKVRGYC
ncbi:YdcF family protein [Hymenobacter sp. RP-2-7]|uniref:YdcF family protein n=1 Tax=Hymenobacter polaris TaxID=2682546 RepID=A0A7Y0ACH4_9BACT|nr:YdcF family protein [Hymenobacter polaris]NML64806.1 YdcF family protein [Hymenobacter polaris]